MQSLNCDSNRQRGESLVEILVAMAILLVILVGVLQLFTMALLSYHATTAHREMMSRAEAVVEVIRLVRSSGVSGTSGVLPLNAGTRNLPVSSGDAGYDFWGPSGYGVIDPDARYRVAYSVADGGGQWVVTVLVEPNTSSGNKYLGTVGGKAVRYASRVQK